MEIRLDHVIPHPLKETDTSQSEVWGAKLGFETKELVQIKAPSGRGKSTFVNILYGSRKDYDGDAFIDGTNIRKLSHNQWADLRRDKLSVVFQDLRLFPGFTGWENIFLKMRLTDYYDKAQVEQMAQRLGVGGLMNKQCGKMSFGERQRFAIIRALVQPFEWILLDEPFSHLDDMNSKKASELIAEECTKRQAGALVAGLDIDAYFDYSKRVML